MAERSPTEVDDYLSAALVGEDAVLDAALESGVAAGLPRIEVTPTQGKFLHLLARMLGTRRILELGTLAGYSTIWLARALPSGGRLVTLEADPRYAEVAQANLERAGVADRVEVRVGRALDTLPALDGPFDLIFIDADKESSPGYVREALRLSRPGGVILLDNLVRGGAVADADSDDPRVRGMRDAIALMASEPALDATALQTVGAKGHDGFAIALVR